MQVKFPAGIFFKFPSQPDNVRSIGTLRYDSVLSLVYSNCPTMMAPDQHRCIFKCVIPSGEYVVRHHS